MKNRRNQLIFSLLNKKTDTYNDEKAIKIRWSDVQETEKILFWLSSLKITKQVDEKIFTKK